MKREDLVDLNAFMAVAEARSFTRAAAKLGTSQSSLSHTVRRLETRLGVRLLTRTTRSVAPTAAGERLLGTLTPALDSIAAQIAALSDLRDKPQGTIRLTTSEHAAETVLLPVLAPFLADYPDIQVELSIDSSLTDIVADQFDAGVRLGEALAKDMVAVRIGPDLRMAVVGSPAYFKDRGAGRRWAANPRARGLVPALCWLSFVLSESAAAVCGVRPAGRSAALPGVASTKRTSVCYFRSESTLDR